MGKIIIHYEKPYESFFGKYWGLILFPLLPFWLLARDDGMAGYLDIDGSTFKLKYKKKMHPQEIEISEGVHQIIYRKKSKFAIAFNLWTRSPGGTLDNVLDSMGAYDDYKLDGFDPQSLKNVSTHDFSHELNYHNKKPIRDWKRDYHEPISGFSYILPCIFRYCAMICAVCSAPMEVSTSRSYCLRSPHSWPEMLR